MTKTEEIKFEALCYAGVPELPPSVDKTKDVWLFAIAKVKTMVAEDSYVIVRNNYGVAPSIVKTFDSKGVSCIEEIYPYEFVDMSFAKSLKTEESIRDFVAAVYKVDRKRVDELALPKLKELFYNYAIKKAISERSTKKKVWPFKKEQDTTKTEEPKKTTRKTKKNENA